ncbi:MAG: transaldolase, partial [Gammaproteobacteria bacterium]|nr:transaldolase [Gammaproteobacteria bacterium]
PQLLDELKTCNDALPRMLDPAQAALLYKGDRLDVSEKSFRFLMNQDAMATNKLAEGIRGFVADIEKLEVIVQALLFD